MYNYIMMSVFICACMYASGVCLCVCTTLLTCLAGWLAGWMDGWMAGWLSACLSVFVNAFVSLPLSEPQPTPTLTPRISLHCVRQCGTLSPVWMNGTHPSVSDGIVSRQACSNTGLGSCCDSSLQIGVKNCVSFFVYYLYPTPACPMAYCFGKSAVATTPFRHKSCPSCCLLCL